MPKKLISTKNLTPSDVSCIREAVEKNIIREAAKELNLREEDLVITGRPGNLAEELGNYSA